MRPLTHEEQEKVRQLIEEYKPIAFDDARLSREENNLYQAYLNGGWSSHLAFYLAFCRGKVGSDEYAIDENGKPLDRSQRRRNQDGSAQS